MACRSGTNKENCCVMRNSHTRRLVASRILETRKPAQLRGPSIPRSRLTRRSYRCFAKRSASCPTDTGCRWFFAAWKGRPTRRPPGNCNGRSEPSRDGFRGPGRRFVTGSAAAAWIRPRIVRPDLEPFAVSFFPGWPKAASPPGGIYDDDGVFQTLSWSLIVRARWIARARFAR